MVTISSYIVCLCVVSVLCVCARAISRSHNCSSIMFAEMAGVLQGGAPNLAAARTPMRPRCRGRKLPPLAKSLSVPSLKFLHGIADSKATSDLKKYSELKAVRCLQCVARRCKSEPWRL
jgi:hypothetical protein